MTRVSSFVHARSVRRSSIDPAGIIPIAGWLGRGAAL
jgi:hypothetical protein